MRYYHDQHIGVYENAVSDEWCDKIIAFFENNSKDIIPRATDKFGPGSLGVRDSSIFLHDEDFINEFNTSFGKVFSIYNYKYPYIPPNIGISEYKLQKTLPTEGFHPYHIEQGSTPSAVKRVGVYTVYLNDVEEGGETEFLYQLKRLKPKKGTICIFPAGYTHAHRGNTPFSGEKYIMTGWLEIMELNEDKY
jgi:hypothetical protein